MVDTPPDGLKPIFKGQLAEKVYTHNFNLNAHLDMTPVAANALIRRAEADEKVEQAKAETARWTQGVPSQQETKRDIDKTGIIVFGVLVIVGVAAFKLSGDNLTGVLKVCVGVLVAAWPVSEVVKAIAKRRAKDISPGSSPGKALPPVVE
jgi:hypothetical protein